VKQVVIEAVGEHSAKPDEVRNRIVELMGNVPRLEMFARKKVEKWDVWGLEVVSDVEIRHK
jgi:site-specific DNA-methyltransferase (adenine-specific)